MSGSIDLTQPVNIVVTIKDQGLTVGATNLSAAEAAAVAQHFEAQHSLVLVRDEGNRDYADFCAAQRQGDPVAGARSLVATVEHSLPVLGVQPVADVDLTDMPQRQGAAAAARATAQVVETKEPPSPARDQKVATLRQQADTAESLDTLRDGFHCLVRQIAGNEVETLTGLETRVEATVEPYRHRLATEPLLKRDLEPALTFLDGAAAQANHTRKRNEAWRASTENRLKEELTAKARAEGRRDATTALNDRLAALFTKGE